MLHSEYMSVAADSDIDVGRLPTITASVTGSGVSIEDFSLPAHLSVWTDDDEPAGPWRRGAISIGMTGGRLSVGSGFIRSITVTMTLSDDSLNKYITRGPGLSLKEDTLYPGMYGPIEMYDESCTYSKGVFRWTLTPGEGEGSAYGGTDFNVNFGGNSVIGYMDLDSASTNPMRMVLTQ